jgi:hypothetical protein
MASNLAVDRFASDGSVRATGPQEDPAGTRAALSGRVAVAPSMIQQRTLVAVAATFVSLGVWATPTLARTRGDGGAARLASHRPSSDPQAHAPLSDRHGPRHHRARPHASLRRASHRHASRRRVSRWRVHKLRATRARSAPVLYANGVTLRWTATARSHRYVESRTTPLGTTYVQLARTTDNPPTIPGITVSYRVRPLYGLQSWSNQIAVSYSPPARVALDTLRQVETVAGSRLKTRGKHETQSEREAREKAEREAREKAEREAREKAEREAKERAEREAREKAEREAREKAEREAREKLEPESVSGAVVKALPTGPPVPASGWHVAFADGFGTAIGSGLGQDNLWQMPSGYEPAEQSNDLNVYNASQVRVGANGLELVAHHQPNVGGTGKNYVSGAVYTIGHFTLRSYAGATFAVECLCRWPHNAGAADPAFWHDGSEGGPEQEVDDFEGFGWNSDGSTEWGAAMPQLVNLGGHTVYHTEGVLKAFGFDPTLGFHRYTTVIGPGAAGKTRADEYIDGAFKWGFEVTTPSSSSGEHIILSYALREYPERVPAEDTTFAARSVAVYEDGAHAGQFVTGGGVAPGTVVK